MNHTGFLSDIVEHPEDDAPRLIYADWLQDQGSGRLPPRAAPARGVPPGGPPPDREVL
jgi:uncharacterized protein (TIGR02996 family)